MMPEPLLSALFRQLVKAAPSGLSAEQIASLLGMPYATLMSELSGQPRHKLGADLIPRLMDLTGSDLPLVELAKYRGGLFVKLPTEECASVEPLALQMVQTIADFSRFLETLTDSIRDGIITQDERMRITNDGNRTLSAILALQQLVEQAAARDAGRTTTVDGERA